MLSMLYIYLPEEPILHYHNSNTHSAQAGGVCKSDDDVAFLMHLVLHDSEYSLVWSNIACIKIPQNLIMAEVILSNLDVSSIIPFVDVLKDVFHTSDSCAYLHIHMTIELYQ